MGGRGVKRAVGSLIHVLSSLTYQLSLSPSLPSSPPHQDEKEEDGTEKWQRRATIFSPGHKLKSNRTISFNTTKDIALNLVRPPSLP